MKRTLIVANNKNLTPTSEGRERWHVQLDSSLGRNESGGLTGVNPDGSQTSDTLPDNAAWVKAEAENRELADRLMKKKREKMKAQGMTDAEIDKALGFPVSPERKQAEAKEKAEAKKEEAKAKADANKTASKAKKEEKKAETQTKQATKEVTKKTELAAKAEETKKEAESKVTATSAAMAAGAAATSAGVASNLGGPENTKDTGKQLEVNGPAPAPKTQEPEAPQPKSLKQIINNSKERHKALKEHHDAMMSKGEEVVSDVKEAIDKPKDMIDSAKNKLAETSANLTSKASAAYASTSEAIGNLTSKAMSAGEQAIS